MPVKADLVVIYGAANIDKWSDLDNDNDSVKKTARITWAVTNAYNYVLGRLARKYLISEFTTYPYTVFDLIARRAGIELYANPRGLVDGGDESAQLNSQSLKIEAILDQILSGQLTLLDTADASMPIEHPGINNSTARFPLTNWNVWENRRPSQWTGEPCVTPNSNFYADQ